MEKIAKEWGDERKKNLRIFIAMAPIRKDTCDDSFGSYRDERK